MIALKQTTTNHREMTSEERARRVDQLFSTIANTASLLDYTKNDVSKTIEPYVSELWKLTQLQQELGELDHKHVGARQPIAQAMEE